MLVRVVKEEFDGCLYHLTDERNAESIASHGLLSKAEAVRQGITAKMPGGDNLTRFFDARDGLTGPYQPVHLL